LKTDATTIAWRGVAVRVATSAAIELAASRNPLVVAKATASTKATTSPAFISRLYGRQGRDRQRRRPDELDLVETMIKPSTD